MEKREQERRDHEQAEAAMQKALIELLAKVCVHACVRVRLCVHVSVGGCVSVPVAVVLCEWYATNCCVC